MTERDQPTRRGAAGRLELSPFGWEPKGRGAKTIWQSPTDGRWYADYQAVEMQRRGERGEEEDRLLEEHGFERAQPRATVSGGRDVSKDHCGATRARGP